MQLRSNSPAGNAANKRRVQESVKRLERYKEMTEKVAGTGKSIGRACPRSPLRGRGCSRGRAGVCGTRRRAAAACKRSDRVGRIGRGRGRGREFAGGKPRCACGVTRSGGAAMDVRPLHSEKSGAGAPMRCVWADTRGRAHASWLVVNYDTMTGFMPL